jgi:inosine/xanthosine triphosphate pyrophosphatase family protein
LGKTMAELSMDEKNRLSHRARAVMNAKPILATIFR